MADQSHMSAIKRQQYVWLPNMKISELLDSNLDRRAQSAYIGTGKLPSGSLSSAAAPTSSNASRQSSRRLSQSAKDPWVQHHKKKNGGKEMLSSSSVADIESKLSSLVLDHTDDEIYKRHFLQSERSEGQNDDTMGRSTVEGDFSQFSRSSIEPEKPMPQNHGKTSSRSCAVVEVPKKSRRHRFCLSNFPHTKRRQKTTKNKEIDEFQSEVTIDQKGLKQSWEYHVLAKLSGDTQCFINHRFDGKEKPKEKLVDFLDAGYRDKDRVDYMTRKKKRLFDLSYKHEDFPNASTHL